MAVQSEKSVDELAQMYEKLNTMGLLDQFLEKARSSEFKKVTEKVSEKVEEKVEEKVKEKIVGVRKIEHWCQDKEKIIKAPYLISDNDFTAFYDVTDKDFIVFDVLEIASLKGDCKINEKSIISSTDFYKNLKNKSKIDLNSETGIRSIKIETEIENLFLNTGRNINMNGNVCRTVRKIPLECITMGEICLVKESDFCSFPIVDLLSSFKKDTNEKFCVFDSWLFSSDPAEKVIIATADMPKMLTCATNQKKNENQYIVLTHVITIDEHHIATEKHVVVNNRHLLLDDTVYEKVRRIYSPSLIDSTLILINGSGFKRLKHGCLLDNKKIIESMIFCDKAHYQGTHTMCAIDESIYQGLNYICPKNKKLNETEYNKITHYSPSVLQKMLITAQQFNEIQKETNTVNVSACIITFFDVTNNNITEEIAVTHTSWKASLTTLFKLDDKSEWVKVYMRNKDYSNISKEKFTFESQPATFITLFLQGTFVGCIVTDDQLAKID